MPLQELFGLRETPTVAAAADCRCCSSRCRRPTGTDHQGPGEPSESRLPRGCRGSQRPLPLTSSAGRPLRRSGHTPRQAALGSISWIAERTRRKLLMRFHRHRRLHRAAPTPSALPLLPQAPTRIRWIRGFGALRRPGAEVLARLKYPNHVSLTMDRDSDAHPPRELTPAAFYGCFDRQFGCPWPLVAGAPAAPDAKCAVCRTGKSRARAAAVLPRKTSRANCSNR